MVIKRLLYASALCLLLSAMRDPFQPPQASCQSSQPERWRYHGVVAGGQMIGFLQDAGGGWHRAVAGERLTNGWRVVSVATDEITLAPEEACKSEQWRLKRVGAQNEKMVSSSGGWHPVGDMGAGGESRHADAG